MNKSYKTILIVSLIIVAALGFYGGTIYASGKGIAPNGQMGFEKSLRLGGNMPSFSKNGLNGINGEILSMDDKSITVKLRDGGSKLIFYSPSSKVMKMTEAPVSDLKTGDSIMITGKSNSDGSVTAESIQIRPAMPALKDGRAPQVQ